MILALVLSLLINFPVLTSSSEGKALHVEFSKGADAACSVFTSTFETIEEDGKTVPYEPRHCWILDPGVTSYNDDWAFIQPNGHPWNVHVEVYYPAVDNSGWERTFFSNPITITY
jgi:hypothetical protein